jgi:hypothetical protein
MRRGFVTFTTGGAFMKLTEVLVKSLLRFSNHPITIFALNAGVPFSYPNMDPVIRKDIASLDFGSICYEKLFASFSNPYDAGVMMDADMVVNRGIDVLLDEATSVGDYPHGSEHPCDPNNQHELMSLLGVPAKTQPYVHATFLFSERAKSFLEDCYRTAKWLQSIGTDPPNKDETVLNVKLWQREATTVARCYDPYYDVITNYLRGQTENPHCHLFSLDRALVFHGCKDLAYATWMLEQLSRHHGV